MAAVPLALLCADAHQLIFAIQSIPSLRNQAIVQLDNFAEISRTPNWIGLQDYAPFHFWFLLLHTSNRLV